MYPSTVGILNVLIHLMYLKEYFLYKLITIIHLLIKCINNSEK